MPFTRDKTPIYRLRSQDEEFQGRINLWVRGFKLQSIVSINDVVNAIERLPSRHLQGLKEIIYDPKRNTQASSYSAWQALARSKGGFMQNDRLVVMYDFDSNDMFYQILFHEIGHYVFYLILDSTLKKQWVTQIYPNSQYITEYASTNASEDFAETYAAFVLRPSELNRIPVKYSYMLNQVFKGHHP